MSSFLFFSCPRFLGLGQGLPLLLKPNSWVHLRNPKILQFDKLRFKSKIKSSMIFDFNSCPFQSVLGFRDRPGNYTRKPFSFPFPVTFHFLKVLWELSLPRIPLAAQPSPSTHAICSQDLFLFFSGLCCRKFKRYCTTCRETAQLPLKGIQPAGWRHLIDTNKPVGLRWYIQDFFAKQTKVNNRKQ